MKVSLGPANDSAATAAPGKVPSLPGAYACYAGSSEYPMRPKPSTCGHTSTARSWSHFARSSIACSSQISGPSFTRRLFKNMTLCSANPFRLLFHGALDNDGFRRSFTSVRFPIVCKTPRRTRVTSDRKDLLYRVDEQLKGSQPLLTVDDDSPLDRPGGEWGWLKDHSTHEVCLGPILHERLNEIGYIVPQRLPLFVLLPHVTTLKVRDFVPNWVSEQLLRALEVSLHVQRPRRHRPDVGAPRRRRIELPPESGFDVAGKGNSRRLQWQIEPGLIKRVF